MLAIRCKNLVKRYDGKPPVEAVRGLDLAVEQGECFGLLGPTAPARRRRSKSSKGCSKRPPARSRCSAIAGAGRTMRFASGSASRCRRRGSRKSSPSAKR